MSDSPSVQVQDGVIRGINIPFMNLTWFLVKFSFASALAFVLTSVIWVAIGIGMMTALASIGGIGALFMPHPPPVQSEPQGLPSVAPVEEVAPVEVAPSVVVPATTSSPVPVSTTKPATKHKKETEEDEPEDVVYQNPDPGRVMTSFDDGADRLSRFREQKAAGQLQPGPGASYQPVPTPPPQQEYQNPWAK